MFELFSPNVAHDSADRFQEVLCAAFLTFLIQELIPPLPQHCGFDCKCLCVSAEATTTMKPRRERSTSSLRRSKRWSLGPRRVHTATTKWDLSLWLYLKTLRWNEAALFHSFELKDAHQKSIFILVSQDWGDKCAAWLPNEILSDFYVLVSEMVLHAPSLWKDIQHPTETILWYETLMLRSSHMLSALWMLTLWHLDHLLTVCLRLLLQSVAFAAQVKTLQEQNAEMEKKISELKLQLEVTTVSMIYKTCFSGM